MKKLILTAALLLSLINPAQAFVIFDNDLPPNFDVIEKDVICAYGVIFYELMNSKGDVLIVSPTDNEGRQIPCKIITDPHIEQ